MLRKDGWRLPTSTPEEKSNETHGHDMESLWAGKNKNKSQHLLVLDINLNKEVSLETGSILNTVFLYNSPQMTQMWLQN